MLMLLFQADFRRQVPVVIGPNILEDLFQQFEQGVAHDIGRLEIDSAASYIPAQQNRAVRSIAPHHLCVRGDRHRANAAS